MMYRIVYRIVALVPRYVSVAKKMYRCSPKQRSLTCAEITQVFVFIKCIPVLHVEITVGHQTLSDQIFECPANFAIFLDMMSENLSDYILENFLHI